MLVFHYLNKELQQDAALACPASSAMEAVFIFFLSLSLLAVIRGLTTKDLYPEFDLELSD